LPCYLMDDGKDQGQKITASREKESDFPPGNGSE